MQAAAHAAAEAASVAYGNSKATAIFICGATGPAAAIINGPYSPTQERGLDGRILYCKSGNASICIEHHGGAWQVKPMSFKGKDECCASVAGACALEACTSRVWRVGDGKALHNQPSVTMVTGADAEQAVSGNSFVALAFEAQNSKPRPLKFTAARTQLSIYIHSPQTQSIK